MYRNNCYGHSNRSATAVHPPLGRNGHPLGHQSHGGADPCIALPVSPAVAADDIATTLNVARSNVSTSIRELVSWGLVRPVHVLGERREHYESLKDVWEMFRIIVEQRKRREVDPTLQLLRRSLEDFGQSGADAHTRERLEKMAEFFEVATAAYDEIAQVPPQALRGFLKVRGRIRKLLRLVAA